MRRSLKSFLGLALAVSSTAALTACPPFPKPGSTADDPTRQYDIREESTAITNLAMVSPDNLWVFNQPSFADDRNLLYSAKQWADGRLPETVSIWRSPVAGGPATKLVPGGENERLLNGRTSPTARQVYMSVGCSVFSVGKTGVGGRRKFASTGYCDYDATPFPDEARILFESCSMGRDCYYADSNYIWIANSDGTNMIQLRQGANATLSPDGRHIAFNYGGDIWVIRVDGSEATNLSAAADYYDIYPAFSRDGRRIYFARQKKSGTDSEGNSTWENPDIWMMGLDGSDQIQLTMNPAVDTQPAVGPDGYVYFVSNRGALVNGRNNRRVWRMQVVGGSR